MIWQEHLGLTKTNALAAKPVWVAAPEFSELEMTANRNVSMQTETQRRTSRRLWISVRYPVSIGRNKFPRLKQAISKNCLFLPVAIPVWPGVPFRTHT